MISTTAPSRANEAVDQLFDAYADDVYRYALYALGDASDAKDVVQEVFLKAFQSWHSLRDDTRPKAWILQITRNHLRDTMRRQRVRRNFLATQRVETSYDDPEVDGIVDMEAALANLKSAYREVITLRFIEDLSIQEAASVLRWTSAKVRATQRRALRALRDMMDQERGH